MNLGRNPAKDLSTAGVSLDQIESQDLTARGVAGHMHPHPQPQLLLLQKTMLVAEGVGRTLDPTVNMWSLARPLIEDWVVANRGPDARIRDVVSGAVQQLERLPRLVGRAEAVVEALSGGYDADRRDTAARSVPNWVVAALVLTIVFLLVSGI